jgi:CRISPR/Cas system-associated exonuclease Cas4 (RecB family)
VIRLSSDLVGVDLAALVAREMIARYKIQREMSRKELEERYKKRVLFAHELTSCALKSRFSKSLHELDLASSFNPRMMIGELIEYGVEKFMQQIGFTKFQGAFVMEMDEFVIAGSPDYISKDKSTIVDVKYSFNPITRDHHIERMQIYLTISNIPRGLLIYISPQGLKSYEVRDKMDQSKIRNLIQNPQIPRYVWECRLCVYSEFCPYRKLELKGEEVG